jgi:hypothetical protein
MDAVLPQTSGRNRRERAMPDEAVAVAVGTTVRNVTRKTASRAPIDARYGALSTTAERAGPTTNPIRRSLFQ